MSLTVDKLIPHETHTANYYCMNEKCSMHNVKCYQEVRDIKAVYSDGSTKRSRNTFNTKCRECDGPIDLYNLAIRT